MKYAVLCVRDVRAGVYGNPFFVSSVGQGMRQFEDEINRPEETNVMYKHPEDFELFELGTFSALDCTFALLERPRQLCEGRSCVRALPQDKRQLPLGVVKE